MARLAEIKNVVVSKSGQPPQTIYVNPLNVTSVEPLPGGTRVTLKDGQVFQTTVVVAEVVSIIDEALQ